MTAVFRSGIKVVDKKKHRDIMAGIMKELDRQENEYLPNVTVDPTEVTFAGGGGVRFLLPQTQFLTVANTGQVWSLSSVKVGRQLLTNDLNQVSSVSLLMTAWTALANEGLFELTRHPS